MDITRNWRLKTSRSQLLAARCPNGTVILPQQTSFASRAAQDVELYQFDTGANYNTRAPQQNSSFVRTVH
ncbi:MAG: hypothetical protein JW966_14675 [Anaerolineae bacterium]|nr:hypothetical protein [Anaerolineae bacterium]